MWQQDGAYNDPRVLGEIAICLQRMAPTKETETRNLSWEVEPARIWLSNAALLEWLGSNRPRMNTTAECPSIACNAHLRLPEWEI